MSTPTNSRTIIISDTHLGLTSQRGCTAESLTPLLAGTSQLIINGDVGELQLPRYRAQAAREIERLGSMCDAQGVKLTLISGNHDAYLSDIRHVCLADQRIVVTHGDVLHRAVAPWVASARQIKADTEAAYDALPPEQHNDIEVQLEVSQHVSHADFVRQAQRNSAMSFGALLSWPWRMGKVLNYWMYAPAKAAQFARQCAPTCQVAIFGHSHRPGIWHRSGIKVINTGSFAFPGRPWAVVVEGAKLSVWRITRKSSQYMLAEKPFAEHTLRSLGRGITGGTPRQ